jgi:uncharacterized membrane protein
MVAYPIDQIASAAKWEKTYSWSRSGHEDNTAKVGSSLIAEGAGSVDQGADAVGLEGRANERGTPGDGSRASLLGSEELFLGVGNLSSLVGLAK